MIAAFALALLVQATPLPSPAASPSSSPSPGPAIMSAQPAALALHPGQPAVVTIAGGAGTLSAALDVPLASLAVDQGAHSIAVTAQQQTGQAVLTVTDSTGSTVSVPVRVADDAGTVPAALSLRVTGDAVDPQWLQTQVQKVLNKSIHMQPGAKVQYGAPTMPALLGPGASADIPVAVQITGDQYFDVNAVTTVAVQNVAAPPFSPAVLFYDDDPEKVIADGVLYRNQVTTAAPARLYYYHQNSTDARRVLVVLSSVQSSDPSTVQLIDASAGPNIDVMSVGHAVSRDFLALKPHNQGIVVDVSAQLPYIADEFTMQPQEGAAGSIGVRLLGGGAVNVTVLAVPLAVTDAQIAQYLDQPPLPGDGHHRTGTFDLNGYAGETLSYTVGGEDALTQYGATTPPASGGAGHDYGDYGVLRTIAFDVTNPGQAPATVYLFEQPLGGVVRSSFLVDGALYQVGCARLAQHYQIGEPIVVQPGSTRVVVQTMTDGGSNYPLGVGMSSTPPIPATPAIGAPDGCFPKPEASAQASPEPEPTAS